MTEKRFGNFVVKGRIGRGGMATVYLATNEKLKRTVALKVLHPEFAADPDFVELFIEEAKKAARLQHPNIITIYSADRIDRYYYIEMEYLRGKDLKGIISGAGRLSIGRGVEIVLAMCDALEYAYAEGDIIAHRDIKPQNIMICTRGKHENVPILTDFGISRAHEDTGKFRTGTVLGTPEYMSPEQAEGRHVDFRTDIYALGVVLYEIVTGRVPFSADSAIATALMHVKDKPPIASRLNPEVPPGLDSIILKCMSKDPGERYGEVGEFVEELRNYREATGDAGAAVGAGGPVSSPHDSKLEELIVMEDERAGAGAGAAERVAGGRGKVHPERPLLYVNTVSLKLPVSGGTKMEVGNRGKMPLEGRLRASAPWIGVSAEKFSLPGGDTVEVGVRALSLPPPEKCSGFVDVESNGGQRRISVSVDVLQVKDRSRRLAAADAAICAALAGGYVLLGLRGVDSAGVIPQAAGGVLAVLLILAVLLKNSWLAFAASLLMLVPAWLVFDFSADSVWAAMAMAFNFAPVLLVMVISRSLFEKRASAWFLVGATPLLLWFGGQFALGLVKGDPTRVFSERPLSGMAVRAERLTPEELGIEGVGETVVRVEIVVERANVRSGNGTNYPVVGSAARGEAFEMVDETESWYRIRYGGGTAWVAKTVCGRVESR